MIKEEGTLRYRLPLKDFLPCIEKIVSDWSRDRNPNFPPGISYSLSLFEKFRSKH